MAIRWVSEPPAPRPGRKAAPRPKYWAFAQALRKNPGEWAILGTASSALAHQIASGKTQAFLPAGSFEAVSRKGEGDPAGRSTIYCRYIGPDIQA